MAVQWDHTTTQNNRSVPSKWIMPTCTPQVWQGRGSWWGKQEDRTSETQNYRTWNKQNKNIRGMYNSINKFKKGYQPRNNFVQDEKCDLVADPCSILNKWKQHSRQLLDKHITLDRVKYMWLSN